MASHQASEGSSSIRALQDSHVTNMDTVYQPSARITRLANHRPLGDSMLAYTQRMREIAQFRQDSALMASEESACSTVSPGTHIHKGPGPRRKEHQPLPPHLRPQSLDELIGRKAEESVMGMPRKKNRRYSVPNRLPPSTVPPDSVQDKDKARVQISFVSASDLFDLVSFSLRSKPSRDESMKQARYEESLMKKPDFLGSISSRQMVKVAEEKEEEEDKQELAVLGVPSPRDAQKDSHNTKRHGKNSSRLKDRKEADKATQHDNVIKETARRRPEASGRHSMELFREKQLLLLQSPRLRHRPKRAKRMTLHRSQLTAIPEDERRRQEGSNAQVQEMPSTRMPMIPSSSSLTAIKSTRKGRAEHASVPETKPPKVGLDRKGDKFIEYKPSLIRPVDEISKDISPIRKPHRLQPESMPGDEPRKVLIDHTTSKKSSVTLSDYKSTLTPKDPFPRRKSKSDKLSSWHNSRPGIAHSSRTHPRMLNGQSLALIASGSRARVQGKFSKLIFLRDTSDHTRQRYS